MKIKELVEEFYLRDELYRKLGALGEGMKSEDLEPIKSKLLECDEFKNLKELKFIEAPLVEDVEGNPVESWTFKASEDTALEGIYYLYGIIYLGINSLAVIKIQSIYFIQIIP